MTNYCNFNDCLLDVPETVSMAEYISSLFSCQPTHSLTVRQTLTLVSRTVGWVGQAALVTPFIHT